MQDITAQLENPQQIEVFVSGPEDANRLYLCTGMGPVGLGAYSNPNGARESFVFHVGPTLTRRQLVRATASVSFAVTSFYEFDGTSGLSFGLQNVEADWDDEAQQVEVRFEVFASSENLNATVVKISYQVTILAALPVA
jgi:hypothetical protein